MFSRKTYVYFAIAAIVSDVMLVATPLWILRPLFGDPRLRFRIIATFSVSLITTVAAIIHAVVLTTPRWIVQIDAGVIEAFVACVASNALVLIPFMMFRSWQPNETFLASVDVTRNRYPLGSDTTASSIYATDMTSEVVPTNIIVDRTFSMPIDSTTKPHRCTEIKY